MGGEIKRSTLDVHQEIHILRRAKDLIDEHSKWHDFTRDYDEVIFNTEIRLSKELHELSLKEMGEE